MLLLLACADGPLRDSGEELLEPCAEEFAVAPIEATTLPYGLVQFAVSGGSGEVRFELVEDQTGPQLNEQSGAYVAGPTPGTDRIAVEDLECAGSASLSVEVVPHMSLAPESATVRPGQELSFSVGGGSGDFDCSLSGEGSLEDCVYTAGAEGVDIVRFTDAVTGEFADATLQVSAEAFTVSGFGGIWAPLGARFVPQAHNGSGAVDLEVLSGALTVEGDAVLVEGDGRLRVSDRYSDGSVDVEVHAVEPLTPEVGRDGERSGQGLVLDVGDVDGDGYADALVGAPEVSTKAYYGGAFYLYAGSADGLVDEPVQVFDGLTRLEGWGKAAAIADLDGDGRDELLLGSGGVDLGATNTGAVRAYGRQDGGFYDEEPLWTLGGDVEYDRFGDAIAACDFDGDGWLDLAIGAPDATDSSASVEADDQGAVHVFRGSAEGFEERADFALYGVLPDGSGGFVGLEDMHLGEALVAADFDGDGACDLAAAAPEADFDGGSNEDGVVLIYRGTAESGLLLERTPALFLATDDGSGGELGRRMAVGDVDGDDAWELAATRWKSDVDASNGGSVHLFALRDLSASAAAIDPMDAALSVHGFATSDYLGSAVDLRDLDGDGDADMLVGAYRDEATGGLVNEGAVHRIPDKDMASAVASPPIDYDLGRVDRSVYGETSGGRFGQAVAGIGDADGDGETDVVVWAGYDPTFGAEAGAAWFLAEAKPWNPQLLQLPAEPAGHEIGRAVALADLDGDGADELFVGVPGAGVDGEGANAGTVFAYDGSTAQEIFGGHPTWTGSDRFGYALTTTDFDGDGYRDVVVAARKDSKPTDYSEDHYDPVGCGGYASLAGGVFIYRGRGDGVQSEPSWVWHHDESSGYVDVVVGGFDRNGDGREDLLIGSTYWGRGGGFALIEGRKKTYWNAPEVVCDARVYEGAGEFDRLGYAVATLGDLDGDGCDEAAVGATGEEVHGDYYNQGIVRVLWGTCGGDTEVTNLGRRVVGSGLGSALDGGHDVDGDGIPDLLVGGAEHRVDFAEVGGAWLIGGAHILEQDRVTLEEGTLPDIDAHAYFSPGGGLDDDHGLIGPEAASLFGEAVALVDDPAGGVALAIGAPQSRTGGTARAGGVAIHRWSDDDGDGIDGIDAIPFAIVVGEDFGPEGQLGGVLLGAGSTLIVGAPQSSANGLELGAVYVIELN